MSGNILDLAPPPDGIPLAYGSDPQQFGELRLPAGAAPHPVVVVIHGGYWRAAYDLKHIGHLCVTLTGAGVATWSLEYRRLGQNGGGWPGTFTDVAAGIDYLRTVAPQYGMDLSRVVVIGHSAGGQLALWAGGRGRIPAGAALYTAQPLPVRGVVGLAAVADLRQGWALGLSNGVVGDLLGGSPTEVPTRYATGSPRDLLPLGLPQRLIHGTADPIVPFTISEGYTQATHAAGDDARLLPLADLGHFELIDPRSAAWPTVRDTVLALLNSPAAP